MVALKFTSSYNIVAFLDKPTEGDGFEQIVDFLNTHSIKYTLTVNPTIYTSCIEQFWTTAKVKTVNEEVQIQALVDKKKVIIIETSVRSDLQLEDAEGTECLPNTTIFEQLTLMGAKTTAWNEFSSTMASAVILFLNKQVEGIAKHKKIYVTPSHTKKVFANMKRQGKDFSGRDTPLFPTMIVQAQEQEGEGSVMPIVPQHTPTKPMADETENVESVPTHSNDPLLSGEDRLKLNELMELCTSLSQRVIALETTKTNQALEIDSLKRRVKKLKKKKGSRTHRLIRLFKVGRSAQVVSSKDEGLGAQEDASKQGRKITDLDTDVEVTLVDEAQGRNDDNLMFNTGVLDEQEVEVEKVVSTAEVTTTSATTTTVDELTLAYTLIDIKAAKPKPVTTASTTTTNSVTRPKARGVVVQEPTELEEEERLARQKEEDANIAEWNNVQAMIDADYELATRLQVQEHAELTFEEWSKMFVELMDNSNSVDSKKQKLDKSVKVKVDDEAEMKKHMELVFDD
ncbi:hypothetical protein Tco_0585524 [Tanacetum coccineum]